MLPNHSPRRSIPIRFDLAELAYGQVAVTGSSTTAGYDFALRVACSDACGEGVNSLSTTGSKISAGSTSFHELLPTHR